MPLPKIGDKRTYIMGVLNVTPDSFYDKGRFFDTERTVGHAIDMAADGADIIDVGGESTRPGAEDVSAEEESRRVMPVVEAISKKSAVSISVDTRKARVAEEALENGASIINDVSALRHDSKMAGVIAKHGATVILMHMKGSPKDMQINPVYGDVVKEIISSLKESIGIAENAGIAKDKIIIDPGIGFGKTAEHNLEILRRLDELKVLNCPICVGTSRKSFIGKVLGPDSPDDRLAGTLATCTLAVMNGAKILRVHDVKEACQAARVTDAIINSGKNR